MPVEGLRETVVRLFKGFFDEPHPWSPRPRLDHLPFSLHLVVGAASVELFPPGPLDPLRFFQRHHASAHHELEYVLCRPAGAAAEEFQAYGVVRLRDEDRVPLLDPARIEKKLRADYGTFVHLPRARWLMDRQHGPDLNDEDPPEGLNHVRPREGELAEPGRMSVGEVLHIIRKELSGPEVISWLEGAFRQPPRRGHLEHRYYLDAEAGLYLVRDHPTQGKALYRAQVSEAALRPSGR